MANGYGYTDVNQMKDKLSYASQDNGKRVLLNALSICSSYSPRVVGNMVNWEPEKQLGVVESFHPDNIAVTFKEDFYEGIFLGAAFFLTMTLTGLGLTLPFLGGIPGAIMGGIASVYILRFWDSVDMKKRNEKWSDLQQNVRIVADNFPTIAYALDVLQYGSEAEKESVEEMMPNLLKEAAEQVRRGEIVYSATITSLNEPADTPEPTSFMPPGVERSSIQDVLHHKR